MNPLKPVSPIVLCDACRKVIPELSAIGRPPLCPRCHKLEKDYPVKPTKQTHQQLRQMISEQERMDP